MQSDQMYRLCDTSSKDQWLCYPTSFTAFRTHHAPCLSTGYQATTGKCDLRRPLVGHSVSRGLASGLLLLGESARTTSWGSVCGEWPPTVGTWEPVLAFHRHWRQNSHKSLAAKSMRLVVDSPQLLYAASCLSGWIHPSEPISDSNTALSVV